MLTGQDYIAFTVVLIAAISMVRNLIGQFSTEGEGCSQCSQCAPQPKQSNVKLNLELKDSGL